jgi:ribosomal protein S1
MSNQKLITNADVFDVLDSPFADDKERIKYISQHYGNMSIAKAFSVYYGLELDNETKSNRNVNTVNVIELGKIYTGTVKEFTKSIMTFDIPGVKEEIICKEPFATCMDSIRNYLLTHDNKLIFEVREKDHDKYYVSVINAYYKAWENLIKKAIEHEDGIEVHIDELVRGGYVCHTNITTLCELTGKNYTSSVFIPGSHIVLNIERDFEKWIGEDVVIVPQKFVEFKKDLKTGLTENSLVGSRKRVLQILGMKNMYDIYNEYQTIYKLASISKKNEGIAYPSYKGTVTGIINSNKKTGIFIELNDMYITGLLPIDSSELLDYHPGDEIDVKVAEFEVQEGKEPFIVNKKNQLVKCNVRPVFELA